MTDQKMEHVQRTFGRTSSRLNAQTLDKLQQRLVPFQFQESDLTVFEEVELEVGMGNGLALFERAKARREKLFIGSEVYQNGVRSLVNAVEQHNKAHPDEVLTNIRITDEDARAFMKKMPAASVSRVCLHYPDPWPKTKHKRRRIFNNDFLVAVERLLKTDGTAEFFAATDIPDYALNMLSCAYENGLFMPTAIQPSEWATAPNWWVSTKYEAKAMREGRYPFYFTFKRKNDFEQVNHNLKTKPE